MNRTTIAWGGFTLVEILLAMALLGVVLAGVYAGLETFRRVTTMGREQATEQQLARAIRARLLTDLRSVRFAEPEVLPDDTPADDSPADDGATADDATAAAAEPVPVPEVGLVGNADTLTIYAALPGRGLDYATGAAAGPAGRVSDLRTVTWFLAGQGGTLSAAVAGRDGPGLARSEGDTAAVAAAEQLGDLPGLLAAATLLAPEVTALQFRYFDGAEWLSAWDSSVSGALPRAVEVLIEIDLDGAPALTPGAAEDAEPDRGPVVTRLLVCPPLSEPSAEAGL